MNSRRFRGRVPGRPYQLPDVRLREKCERNARHRRDDDGRGLPRQDPERVKRRFQRDVIHDVCESALQAVAVSPVRLRVQEHDRVSARRLVVRLETERREHEFLDVQHPARGPARGRVRPEQLQAYVRRVRRGV